MNNPTARPPEEVAGDEVLDGTDPHAGDEADWENDEPAAPIGVPHSIAVRLFTLEFRFDDIAGR